MPRDKVGGEGTWFRIYGPRVKIADSIPRRVKARVKIRKSPSGGIQAESPGRALCRALSLTTEPSPLADNQSEYSVGSEEEDEDFDERPEGSVCFLTFYNYSSHCP